MDLLYSIKLHVKNIPGWRTSRKIVVFESDDWGSIRMPSKDGYNRLLAAGLTKETELFDKYETLETRSDLEQLFDILISIRDRNNNPVVITPLTVMANPDFEKIESTGFKEYHYEKFTETLRRYYPADDVFGLWKEGIKAGIFIPELHGREHLAVQLWMDKLKEGDEDSLFAFNHGFVSSSLSRSPDFAHKLRAEFYFKSEDQKPFLKESIKDSIYLFREVFGYSPRVFVPPNSIFHPEFDHVVAASGIRYLYVSQSMPYPVNGGSLKYRSFITGQRGPLGLIYYTRNCAFEPILSKYNGIDNTLRQVAAAFTWGKPAIISTHRANFSGGIDQKNRLKGLSEMKKLLKAIKSKWPDIEFMASGDALDCMQHKQ